jgi:benzoyl-CoA 2,3-dioxygenase component A
VDAALGEICAADGLDWPALREAMRAEGRLHVETY